MFTTTDEIKIKNDFLEELITAMAEVDSEGYNVFRHAKIKMEISNELEKLLELPLDKHYSDEECQEVEKSLLNILDYVKKEVEKYEKRDN